MNLKHGIPKNGHHNTCPAGVGTLGLEFGVLSQLIGDPVYESAARRAVNTLWNYRNHKTGLLGNTLILLLELYDLDLVTAFCVFSDPTAL